MLCFCGVLLMSFLAISAMIELLGLIQYVYIAESGYDIPYGFLAVYDAAIPVSQMIIPLGFIIYFYSFNKKHLFTLHGDKVKRICASCCICVKGRKSYARFAQSQPDSTLAEGKFATAPPSSRIEPRSETYFNIPYTGEFTSVMSLVSQEDTGYGSVATINT